MSETKLSSTPDELEKLFMDPNRAKTEAEHWAVREIERLRADRRERIATAALQGLLAYPETQGTVIDFAKMSVRYADALIAELDKEEGKP